MKRKLLEIVSYNQNQIMNGKEPIYFYNEKTGQQFYDPFYDETMRDSVEPMEYYGKRLLHDIIDEYDEKTDF